MNLLIIFLTGLTTGGLSCLAMQGGLLASVVANQKEQEHEELLADKKARKAKNRQQYLNSKTAGNFSLSSFDQLDWLPAAMFLGSKLVAHTILGFMLGLVGSVIALSLEVRLAFQVFTAVFMFATAMNLLNVHPIFRYVVIQPPKFVQRMVKNSSKSKALFAPALLGALTIFIPCGVTQAMEVLAINSGNPVYGAMIMFAFVLGTMPLFAFIGIATAKLSEGWYKKFTKFAAGALILMAVYSLNGVLIVLNSPITVNKIVYPVTYFFSDERFAQYQNSGSTVGTENGIQQVTINVENRGYSPNRVRVKAGVPVEWTLVSNETYSCALAFVFKEFGIDTFLESTDRQTFTFTPTKPGKYIYTCSMGMYTGVLEVI